MVRFLFCVFLVASFQVFAQSNSIQGKIQATSLEGYAINIINFTQGIGTTNDEHGFFEIPAILGDSIVFSSVQYETTSILITNEMLAADIVTVTLSPKVEELAQVRMSNIQLSGNLKTDVNKVPLQPFVDNGVLGLPFEDKPQPTLAERRIITAKSGILDYPINVINGTIKKLKEIKEIEDLKKRVQQGELSMNKSFFVDTLQLPEELLTDFMYYCAEDTSFETLLKSKDALTLLEFFEEKVIVYKAHKEIE